MTFWAKLFTGNPHSMRHDDDRTALATYWSVTPEQLLTELGTSPKGLSQDDAERRLQKYGPNALKAGRQTTALGLLLNQFKSPLVLILVFAAIISAIAGEWPDAAIVLILLQVASRLLHFSQLVADRDSATNWLSPLRGDDILRAVSRCWG